MVSSFGEHLSLVFGQNGSLWKGSNFFKNLLWEIIWIILNSKASHNLQLRIQQVPIQPQKWTFFSSPFSFWTSKILIWYRKKGFLTCCEKYQRGNRLHLLEPSWNKHDTLAPFASLHLPIQSIQVFYHQILQINKSHEQHNVW